MRSGRIGHEVTKMCQVALEIPNEVLYDTKMSKQDEGNL